MVVMCRKNAFCIILFYAFLISEMFLGLFLAFGVGELCEPTFMLIEECSPTIISLFKYNLL